MSHLCERNGEEEPVPLLGEACRREREDGYSHRKGKRADGDRLANVERREGAHRQLEKRCGAAGRRDHADHSGDDEEENLAHESNEPASGSLRSQLEYAVRKTRAKGEAEAEGGAECGRHQRHPHPSLLECSRDTLTHVENVRGPAR